jgi:hypothetical protein
MTSDAPRDQRIPVMMPAAEVSAIDEWRYANHIATRSRAIRQLCQRALSCRESEQEAA